MCGILGFWRASSPPDEALLEQMCDTLRHRGPDGAGMWTDPSGVALAHRRLAVLGLSEAGAQPMLSHDGRWVITFNGEIYNFEALRAELGVLSWRGGSDTEVLLEAISTWGLSRTLERIVGMFAFAVWDRQRRELHMVRDRFGVKPLYWMQTGDGVAFGSELKPLMKLPDAPREVNRSALSAYLRAGCMTGSHSIWEGVQQLKPGRWLTFTDAQAAPAERVYWSAEQAARSGLAEQLLGDDDSRLRALSRQLEVAVKRRMVSDVPLGAFLSGGVDSSLVVALMQQHASAPVKTFSIGFEEAAYDESAHAAAVARHLGADHTTLIATPQDALNIIPELSRYWDEPFADSSQLPSYLVCALARPHVTVALSGDGGDELFGGYNRHRWLPPLWRVLSRLPLATRQAAGHLLSSLPSAQWDQLFELLDPALPAVARVRLPGDKLHKLAGMLGAQSARQCYDAVTAQIADPAALVIHGDDGALGRPPATQLEPPLAELLLLDATGYLNDDILTKVDRASMAVSLEVREPLLDHELFELAWRLPEDMKIRGGQTKWALRQLLDRYVPRALIERPKMGFGVPIDRWLRVELRDWAEALLAPDRLAREGFLRPAPVRAMWEAHLSGAQPMQHKLWTILMFQAWHERYILGECP
jgi:asparagine synthase (glutamine-hydrolysing)